MHFNGGRCVTQVDLVPAAEDSPVHVVCATIIVDDLMTALRSTLDRYLFTIDKVSYRPLVRVTL